METDPPVESLPRRAIRVLAHPLVLLGATAASLAAVRAGYGEGVAVGGVLVAVALTVALLERIVPYVPAWRPTRASFGTDLLHTIGTSGLAIPLAKAPVVAAGVWAGGTLAAAIGSEVWPVHWPLWLQLALAVVLRDLGAYAGHRFMHRTGVGWRIHAVHHTTERLNWLAGNRVHPLNGLLTFTLETTAVALAGIPMELLILSAVFKATNGMLQHSNADLRTGALGYVLATAEVHRWHHSRRREESDTNFGNTTVVWDHLFGTFHLPRDVSPPTTLGIAGSAVPETYAAHLIAPFVLPRFDAPSDVEPGK